ncbi:MAG: glycosyltransferase N-terminal domain-containing protein [bacterium]
MVVLKRESLPAADVWLHGASVGDARALAPLVGALRAARPELRLLYTAWTPEGRAMARQLFAEVPVHRVPWSVALRPSLARVRPRLVVWEYLELWPAWVAACRRVGAATLVVDGRVSRRSLRIRPLLARAAGQLDAFCARSPGTRPGRRASACGRRSCGSTATASMTGSRWRRRRRRPTSRRPSGRWTWWWAASTPTKRPRRWRPWRRAACGP